MKPGQRPGIYERRGNRKLRRSLPTVHPEGSRLDKQISPSAHDPNLRNGIRADAELCLAK